MRTRLAKPITTAAGTALPSLSPEMKPRVSWISPLPLTEKPKSFGN